MAEKRKKPVPQNILPEGAEADTANHTKELTAKAAASEKRPAVRNSKKKSLKEIFRQILTQSMDAGGETAPPPGATLNEAIAFSIARMAAGGDLKAAAFILNILDEEDSQKSGGADAAPTIRVEFDIPRPRGEGDTGIAEKGEGNGSQERR